MEKEREREQGQGQGPLPKGLKPEAQEAGGAGSGGCTHTGPEALARMAEEFLRAKGIPATDWDGRRFGFGESVTGLFKSVYLEIVRRDGDWVVTKISRLHEELPADKAGFVSALPRR